MLTFTYHWLHIPSGNTGTRTAGKWLTREDFLAFLDTNNSANPGVWQYWSA